MRVKRIHSADHSTRRSWPLAEVPAQMPEQFGRMNEFDPEASFVGCCVIAYF